MKIKDLNESTTAGSIAPGTPAKVGKMQKRAGSLFKGKVTNKPFYEAEVNEEEIVEQDLILIPDQIIKKDKGFIPHKEDRRDHEVEMARSDLFAAAKNAMRIYKLLANRTEDEGLMGWQQSYITLASDYLNSVADSVEYNARMSEMTGGVIAGGMSNVEEGVERVDSLVTNALKRMEGPTINDAVKALIVEIGTREFKDRLQHYKFYVNQMVQMYEKQGVTEAIKKPNATTRHLKDHPVSDKEMVKPVKKKKEEKKEQDVKEEQAPMFTPEEEQLDEKKDACYSKVKSRYKVWPSAYASGALSKCRKVGAANWGNKSKK